MDAGLYQTDLAKQIGVDSESIGNWEDGSRFPHVRHLPAIIAFLGFYPFDHETDTLGGKLTRYKNEHGLSNEKLAKLLGVDEGTVAGWVRNERVPLARSIAAIETLLKSSPQ
jgi:transcriptional regulator with XRE-family HTH domain